MPMLSSSRLIRAPPVSAYVLRLPGLDTQQHHSNDLGIPGVLLSWMDVRSPRSRGSRMRRRARAVACSHLRSSHMTASSSLTVQYRPDTLLAQRPGISLRMVQNLAAVPAVRSSTARGRTIRPHRTAEPVARSRTRECGHQGYATAECGPAAFLLHRRAAGGCRRLTGQPKEAAVTEARRNAGNDTCPSTVPPVTRALYLQGV